MRDIRIDLSSDNYLEQPKIFGGYAGEHNETILHVKLPNRMIGIECSGYRFDFQTSEDNKISSPLIPISELNNGIVSFRLCEQFTIAGYLSFNVAAILADEKAVSLVSKTNSVILYIANSPDGNSQLIDPNGYKDELLAMMDERLLQLDLNGISATQAYDIAESAISDYEQRESPEYQGNKIDDINEINDLAEEDAKLLYPNAKAVKNYVGAAITTIGDINPLYRESITYAATLPNDYISSGSATITKTSYEAYTYFYKVKKNIIYNIRVTGAHNLRIAKYDNVPVRGDSGTLLTNIDYFIDAYFSFEEDAILGIYAGSTNKLTVAPNVEVVAVSNTMIENNILQYLTNENTIKTVWVYGGITVSMSNGTFIATETVKSNRLRSDYIYADYPLHITTNEDCKISVIQYDKDKNCNGAIATLSDNVNDVRVPEGYFYKVCVAYRSDANIASQDVPTIVDNITIKPFTLLHEDETDILKLNDIKSIENKMENIKRPFGSEGGGGSVPLVLLHSSDVHSDEKNLQRIKQFYDKFNGYIDNVIHTGDSVYRLYTDDFTFWTGNGGGGFLNMLGNHDAGWSDTDPTAITQKMCYDRYIAPFVSNWGVVQPENAAASGYCYYYKDYLDYGFRLIVLDACHYDDAQNAWFAEVLENARTSNLHAIVSNHFGTYDKVALQSSFCSLDMAVTESNNPYILDTRALDEIETFKGNGGVFVCHICGHTHRDELSYNEAYPEQLFIAVNTAGTIKSGHDFARKRGIKSQDLFNIIGFDHDQKKIKVFRVGADYDLNMRNVNTFCYDYLNHKMIYTS